MRMLVIVALLMPLPALAAPAPEDALRDLRRFRDRVHLASIGPAGLSPDAMTDSDSGGVMSVWDEHVVVEQRDDAVRIVVEEDDARVLLWVSTDDLGWTVTKPTRLFGTGASGVWLQPGAPIDIEGKGARLAVVYTDGELTLRGMVARKVVGHVFRPRNDERYGHHGARLLLREPDGAVLVEEPKHGLGVDVIDRGADDWRLVEHRGKYLRIVGWARVADLDDGLRRVGGTGGGTAYGISDTPRVEVPAGACLFDPVGGAVVGVQTKTALRYVTAEDHGVWSVYFGNTWGLRTVTAKQLGKGKWQMCL